MKIHESSIRMFILVIFIISLILLAYSIICCINDDEDKNNKDIPIPDEESVNKNITITKKMIFSAPNLEKRGIYFKIIDEKATSYTMEEGNIRAPVYSLTYNLPLSAKILDFSFKHSDVETINLDNNIKALSYPVSTLSMSKNKIFYFEKIDNSEIYPSTWYKTTSGGGIFNKEHTKFFNIHIFPQRYSKKEKTLHYIKEAKITFTYENITDDSIENNTYDYLILTPKVFQGSLNPLITHKKTMGLKPIIVNLGEIYNSKYFKSKGRDDQEKIKYFIKDAIENWSIKYVLLVGDEEKIPVRYIHMGINEVSESFMGLASISDLYYSDIYFSDGSFSSWDTNKNNTFGEYNWKGTTEEIDFYPDIYLGRIPCEEIEDVKRVVNKIINYETAKNKKEWYNNMIHCGGDTFPPFRSLLSASNLRLRNMVYILLQEPYILSCEEGIENCEIVSEIMKDFNHVKIYTSVTIAKDNYKPLINYYITQSIEEGAGFLYFAGHGNPTAYATYKTPALTLFRHRPFSGFTTSQVAGLQNNEKLPVVVFDACSCGKFDEEECIAWDFINMDDGGAIATYGCTNLSLGQIGPYNAERLNGFMSIKVFENYARGFNQPGMMLAHGQIDYQNQISKMENLDYLILSIWELFGDPSLIID